MNPVEEPDPVLCKEILWEMYEYGFSIELLRLDQALTALEAN